MQWKNYPFLFVCPNETKKSLLLYHFRGWFESFQNEKKMTTKKRNPFDCIARRTGTLGKSDLFPIDHNFLFFLQIGCILAFYWTFLLVYETMFPGKDPHILPNPLQVIAQISCFFLFYKKRGGVRQRHLFLLHLFCTMNTTLYLQGLPISFLFFYLFIFSISISIFPLEKSETSIYIFLLFYCADPHLSKWGFFLVFQQFTYGVLAVFLEKEENTFIFHRLASFMVLMGLQLLWGFLYYQEFYILEPLRLASLFSGACIVFCCLKERTMPEFIISYNIDFFVSSMIAITVSPTSTTSMLGIPSGIFIFFLVHFWFLLIYLFLFLKVGSIKGKQPLIPIFFAVVFLILPYLPGVEWLERWIEGASLLLLILGLVSILEDPST